jgi:hypothetical protein
MNKLLAASLLLILIATLQTRAFGGTLNCKFSSTTTFDNIETIQLTDDTFKINGEIEIPLEKSIISCGHFGKRDRLDGLALGYQIVLKACAVGAQVSGHIIDEVNEKAADIVCNE